MKYYIVTGEASGDLHGGNLMEGIYRKDPKAVIRYWGGENMNRAHEKYDTGADPESGLVRDYSDGAVMGFKEVSKGLPFFIRKIRFCKFDIFEFAPDVLILIDYPGFNLRIASWAHKCGIKVFYYIAPKVWASREWRIKKMRRCIDSLFIIFPFEKEYFESKGMPYHYFGNPLIDAIDNSEVMKSSKECLLEKIGVRGDIKSVAMLAGSRQSEVKMMMPLLKEVAAKLHDTPEYKDYKFLIAGAPGLKMKDYGIYDKSYMKVVFGVTHEILRVSDAAVINSGTASLEAALIGTPQVVAYRFPSRLTNFLAHLIVKVKYISLGNLCLDRLVFKEFHEKSDFNAESVSEELKLLISDKNYRATMLKGYAKIRESLGESGASERIAAKMVELLKVDTF